MWLGLEQGGFDALQLALLAVVKAHDVLLRSAVGVSTRRGAGRRPGCGSWPASGPASQGGQRRAGRRRATAPRPMAAKAISRPPAQLFDQNIASVMTCEWLRIGPAMISQTASSALPICRLANPRALTRARGATPGTGTPRETATGVAV